MSKNRRQYEGVDLVNWTLKQNEVVPLLRKYVERATDDKEEKKLYELFVDDFLTFSQQQTLCDELDRRIKEGPNPWRLYNTPGLPESF